MNRNLDLIREILIAVENFEPDRLGTLQRLSLSDLSGTVPQNDHHISLLIEAGFINPAGRRDLKTGSYFISGMTMKGHDFLDAIREKSVWQETKSRLTAAGGWTLEIALAVAKEVVLQRLTGTLGE